MKDEPLSPGHKECEIFLEVLEKTTPEERATYLDHACGDDRSLRSSIETLLQNHKDDDFLEVPAYKRNAAFEQPGDYIGDYKLVAQIGEGGWSIVYKAEQEQRLHRFVALKIVQIGMNTPEVIARFDVERQALALMEHPNIARVFDAGSTEAGRPYFVMELVSGVSITRFCDEQKCSIKTRLELFVPICEAIQHAHQKGIIHRDIKPGNILVTFIGGKPVPKVIDFGVAKAMQPLTNKPVVTAEGQFIGTPAYMSPEQAGLKGRGVDARSDIYHWGRCFMN
ncbi:MAG: serine/threonine protein kinase [Verrucomicrobiota bacterium]|nr:serine/threonine protein kinase [Verrucomicrobiota bacterium]